MRISARSNPTGLKELDKRLISISTFTAKNSLFFKIENLSLDSSLLDQSLKLIIVASAGSTSKRFEIGSVAKFDLDEAYDISDLDNSSPIRFRLLVRNADHPRLVASIERIHPNIDEQSDSILPMQPLDLGERLWKLDIVENDGPILFFNSNVFSNASGCENYLPFATLVLPDALRQVMQYISNEPDVLEDENEVWYPWGNWLDSIGVERPPKDLDDEAGKSRWCDEVVECFCNLHKFSEKLNAFMKSNAEND